MSIIWIKTLIFDDLLEKSRMGKSGGTAGGDGSGIYIKGSGSQQIHTSGALYPGSRGIKGRMNIFFSSLRRGRTVSAVNLNG